MSYVWIPTEASRRVWMAGYIPSLHQPWRQRSHQNPNMQWVVANGPNLRFQRGNERLTLGYGDTLMLHPNEPHTSWGPPESGTGFFFVQFTTNPPAIWRKGAPPFLADGDHYIDLDYLIIPSLGSTSDSNIVLTRFEQLVHVWNAQRPYFQLHASAILQEMLVITSRCSSHRGETEGYALNTQRQTDVLQATLQYLDQHYQEPFQAESLSKQLNLSYQYISRVFRLGLGMSVLDYLQRKRIAQAKSLLLSDTYMSVSQVGEAVGYNDSYYFSRVFRKLEGIPPSQFANRAYSAARTKQPR